MRKLIFFASVFALVASRRTGAWWLMAHTVINPTAVATVPEEVPGFLRRQLDWIGARSLAPDSWSALDRKGACADTSSREARDLVYVGTSDATAMLQDPIYSERGKRIMMPGAC